MPKTEDLSTLSAEKLQEFLSSFDTVLSDIDGVVWQIGHPIEGAFESLASLQKLGKKIYLVTNNTENSDETYIERAQCAGLHLNPDDIITIVKVMIWYLNKINFHDKIFAICSDESRNILRKAGIRLTTEEPKTHDKNPTATVKDVIDRPSVKAVIHDFDTKCNWSKLALAVSCLEREDVLFLAGAVEEWIHVDAVPSKIRILGSGPLIRLVSEQSGRKPIVCGKPGKILKDYIFDTYNLTEPQKCLFIGDTINQDMRFASICGFKKLLVGTGGDSLEKAQKEIDTYPDYYLPALSQLFSTHKNLQFLRTINQEDN
ncbi:4-nitrophenylphosphatase-like [Nylanderia fulva]|uniref:4-nitrophenylphosphatase-like n=1 Tax=Nylanderia fulva TaxID=613905 RepID=UPI0010FBA6F2|nr:4-nitrophenylphosphatase-like [Nylanderia fulva]